MSTPVLSTSGLNKRFGSLVVANEIGIALPQGVRYALIGPNGAGKTTLINLMTGMLRPDGGHILLGGEDITALGPEQRVGRGLVRTFQINSLFPHLNPLEAVTLAVCEREKISRVWWRTTADYRAAVDEAYDILKSLLLAPVCTRETRELAYGQQRLLEIALALATKPKVLLLDEPTEGIQPSIIKDIGRVLELLRSQGHMAILLVEQYLDFARHLADRLAVMDRGQVVLSGRPDELDDRDVRRYLTV